MSGQRKGGKGTGSLPVNSELVCFGCGQKGRTFKTDNCPAKGEQSNFCHNRSHWESCCRTKQHSKDLSTDHSHKRNQRHLKRIDPVACNTVSRDHDVDAPFWATLHVCGCNSSAYAFIGDVDSGSYCSAVSHLFFDQKFPDTPLHMPLGPSLAYGGMPIEVFDGFFLAMVEFIGKSTPACLFVSTADTKPIIGCDLINKLGLMIEASKGTKGNSVVGSVVGCVKMPSGNAADKWTPTADYAQLLRSFPMLTLPKLGQFPKFQHQIQLQPNTVPVACRSCPIPLALCEKVKEAVEELDRQGYGNLCKDLNGLCNSLLQLSQRESYG